MVDAILPCSVYSCFPRFLTVIVSIMPHVLSFTGTSRKKWVKRMNAALLQCNIRFRSRSPVPSASGASRARSPLPLTLLAMSLFRRHCLEDHQGCWYCVTGHSRHFLVTDTSAIDLPWRVASGIANSWVCHPSFVPQHHLRTCILRWARRAVLRPWNTFSFTQAFLSIYTSFLSYDK